MNSGHVDDLVDLEALEALEPEESAHVRLHATICATCRAALIEAEDAAARLALAVPLHRAPAELRSRVLGLVAADAPVPPPGSNPRRLAGLTLRANRWGALAAVLLVIPLAGLLIWAVFLQSQVNDLKEDSRHMQEAQRDVILLALPTTIKAKLTPTEHASDARGWVSWNPDEGQCALSVKALPKPEPGTSYRVYYEGPRGVFEAGELKPSDDGQAELRFDVSRWQGRDYRVWVSAVRPNSSDGGTMLLTADLRRE